MQLEALDIILLIIISFTAIRGLINGAVLSITNFIITISSLYFSTWVFNGIQDGFEKYIHSEIILNITSGLVAIFFTWLSISFIARPITGALDKLDLGAMDRFFGFLFGALKGVIYSVVIALFITITVSGSYVGSDNAYQLLKNIKTKHLPSWVTDSTSYSYYNKNQQNIENALPLASLNYHKEWLQDIDLTSDSLSSYDLVGDKHELLDEKAIKEELIIQGNNNSESGNTLKKGFSLIDDI